LHRAALKPTPFGFFAGVAVAELRSDCDEVGLNVSRLLSPPVPPVHDGEHVAPSAADVGDHDGVRQCTRIYLDPGAFQDPRGVWAISRETGEPTIVDGAADVFIKLAQSHQQGASWDEVKGHAAGGDLDRLIAAGVIGLQPGDSDGDENRAPRAGRSHPGATLEDAVHPTVLNFRRDMFSGFLDDVLSHGAITLYPGLLPEQDGLARVFGDLYGVKAPVPLLEFFRDFVAVRRARGLDRVPIQAAATLLDGGSDAGLSEAGAPLAEAVRRALAVDGTAREASLALDLSRYSCWENAVSTRLSMLLTPGPGGLSRARFCIRLWGADRMSLFPRYASALAMVVPHVVDDLRRFMRRWPDTADLRGRMDANADGRPVVTHRTIDVPGCPPGANAIALRDLRVDLDRSTGRLTLTDASGSAGRVTPLFLGVSSLPFRPPLHQFLEILAGRRVSVFELLIRAVSRVLAEDAVWRTRGSVKYVPAVTVGEHVVLSPEMVRIETASIPDVAPRSRRRSFLQFHEWWDEHGLPLVADVHVPRGSLWVDFGSPDGVRSFYGHIRGAEVVHLLLPSATDDDSLRSVEGESHEVEFALEVAARAR